MSKIDVSIVIVNWNTCDILRNCLKSIKDKTKGVKYEVIVIDNDSSDGSDEMVENEFKEFTLIRSGDNLGFAKGNNLAINMLKGEYTFLLNPDTILTYDLVAALHSYIIDNKDIGILAPRLLNGDLTFQSSYSSFPTIKELIRYNLVSIAKIPFILTNKLEDLKNTKAYSRNVDWVRGAAMLMPTELFLKIGGFSEDYFMYYEDTDICYKTWKENYRVYYKADETLIHLYNQSASKVNKFREKNLEIAKSQFLKKFYSKRYCLIYNVLEVIFLVISLFFNGIFSFNKNVKKIFLSNLYRLKLIIRR